MAFKNRVRLPMKITRPQFPEERKVFRKINGVTKTLSVVIRKEYEGETDFLPEGWHQKLKIAMAHDEVRIEGDKYLGNISAAGEYTIEWPEFLDYPTSKAKFKAEVTPFAETNSNCMSCEEATQLSLEDDTVEAYGGLQEDTTYEQDLTVNDSICCYPATFSVFWFNTAYITSAEISQTGVLTIHTGVDLVSANGLKIATYRVTCPNGGYDEADVYASFAGTVEGCLAPTNLQVTGVGPNEATFEWTEPFELALFEWELYEGNLPIGSPVQVGLLDTETTAAFLDLDSNTEYYFRVRTVCGDGNNSNWISTTTDTPVQGDTCGSYSVTFDDGTGVPSNARNVRYRNCLGELDSQIIFNGQTVFLCAYQSAPGVPLSILGTDVTYNYEGLC